MMSTVLITIAGQRKTGKSALVYTIAMMMRQLGLQVTAGDVNGEIEDATPRDIQQTAPQRIGSMVRDGIRIHIQSANLRNNETFDEWFAKEYPLYAKDGMSDTSLKHRLRFAWEAGRGTL